MTPEEALAIEYDRIRQIERHAAVAFVRRQADLMDHHDRSDAADALIVVAACIENGDHR